MTRIDACDVFLGQCMVFPIHVWLVDRIVHVTSYLPSNLSRDGLRGMECLVNHAVTAMGCWCFDPSSSRCFSSANMFNHIAIILSHAGITHWIVCLKKCSPPRK